MKTRPKAPSLHLEGDPATTCETGKYRVGELQELLTGKSEDQGDTLPPSAVDVVPDPFPSQRPTDRPRTAAELLEELDEPVVEVTGSRDLLQLPLKDGEVVILDDDGEY